MRVMFIVQRYHTNMVPMVVALQTAGHEPCVICQYEYRTDNYEALKPVVIEENCVDLRVAFSMVRRLRPDLLVIRELRGQYINFVAAARSLGVRCIRYDLAPFNRAAGVRGALRGFGRHIMRKVRSYPQKRITPVFGDDEGCPDQDSHWFPFPMAVDRRAQKSDYSSERPIVLCVGKLAVPRKRHDWVLAAVTQLGLPCHVLLVGSGNDVGQFPDNRSFHYYCKIRDTKNTLGEGITAKVLSDVPHKEMSLLYRSADILAFPAAHEPFGICALEAMASGCAVLVSDSAGVAGTIQDGYNGFKFEESSFREFSEKLGYLISNPRVSSRIASNGYETILSQHNHEKFVRTIERMCD